jgi:uncharacterized protein (DUF1330 family)/ketosteroid isomerase-like protein
MTATPRQLLDRFQQAMLDFSADALADLFAEDAVYEFVFLAPHRQTDRYDGREEIRAGFARAWGSLPSSPLKGFRDVRIHDTADPEVVISEHEVDAVDPASGREFMSRFLLVLRARDGEIVHLRDYADILRVFGGLGRLPQLLDLMRTEPAAYVLSEVQPRPGAAFDRYRELAAESIARHGGRYLVRGGDVHAAEGDWPDGETAVLVEFPSRRALDEWYRSADYAEALAVRDAALERRLLFLDGVEH